MVHFQSNEKKFIRSGAQRAKRAKRSEDLNFLSKSFQPIMHVYALKKIEFEAARGACKFPPHFWSRVALSAVFRDRDIIPFARDPHGQCAHLILMTFCSPISENFV